MYSNHIAIAIKYGLVSSSDHARQHRVEVKDGIAREYFSEVLVRVMKWQR